MVISVTWLNEPLGLLVVIVLTKPLLLFSAVLNSVSLTHPVVLLCGSVTRTHVFGNIVTPALGFIFAIIGDDVLGSLWMDKLCVEGVVVLVLASFVLLSGLVVVVVLLGVPRTDAALAILLGKMLVVGAGEMLLVVGAVVANAVVISITGIRCFDIRDLLFVNMSSKIYL